MSNTTFLERREMAAKVSASRARERSETPPAPIAAVDATDYTAQIAKLRKELRIQEKAMAAAKDRTFSIKCVVTDHVTKKPKTFEVNDVTLREARAKLTGIFDEASKIGGSVRDRFRRHKSVAVAVRGRITRLLEAQELQDRKAIVAEKHKHTAAHLADIDTEGTGPIRGIGADYRSNAK